MRRRDARRNLLDTDVMVVALMLGGKGRGAEFSVHELSRVIAKGHHPRRNRFSKKANAQSDRGTRRLSTRRRDQDHRQRNALQDFRVREPGSVIRLARTAISFPQLSLPKGTLTVTWNCRFFGAIAVVATLAASSSWAAVGNVECSADDWQACAGKPWVDSEVMDTPLGSKWWPHPLWGEGDKAGSANWYTQADVVMRALAQISKGKAMNVGHDYVNGMPLFGERKFSLRIPGTPTSGAFGANQIMWNDEFPVHGKSARSAPSSTGLGTSALGVGTVGDNTEMRWYNGFTAQQMGDPYGLNHLGSEKLHPIIARGILIDVAAFRDAPMEKGNVATMADINAAFAEQVANERYILFGGIQHAFNTKEAWELWQRKPPSPKRPPSEKLAATRDDLTAHYDLGLIRTRWGRYWEDPPVFNDSCPGIGMEVARWIAETTETGVTGFDTRPGDAIPNPDPACAFCVHTYPQTRHGIVNQENLKLSTLVDAGVYQFAYFYSPVPVRGATGSFGSPAALW